MTKKPLSVIIKDNMINEVKIRPYFLFGLLAVLSVIIIFLFLPFISALVLAGTFAIILRPLYLKTLKYFKYPSLSAFLVLIIVLVLIILPVSLVLGGMFMEARQFLETEQEIDYLNQYTQIISDYININFPDIDSTLNTLKDQFVTWLIANLNTLFSSVLKTAIGILLFFFALFYLLKDGYKFKNFFVLLSPLKDDQDNQIFHKLRRTINSVVLGSLLIALIQGVAAAIGLAIFGVPQPILLGAITAILSIIPGVGPSLLYIPIVIFKFLTGDMIGAIGLTIWGLIMILPVDELLRPYFIERGMKVHPFFILISVLGGIILFGPIGFVLGPIIFSLFFALITIYIDNLEKQND